MTTRRATTSSLTPPLRLDNARTITDVSVPPTISMNLLFVTRRNGSLEVFDEKTGAIRWKMPLPTADVQQPYAGSPVIINDLLYARSANELISIDINTGELTDRQSTPLLDLHDGVFVDNCFISFIPGGGLQAWDIEKRALRWSIRQGFSPVPLVADGNRLVVGGSVSISTYDVTNAKELWTTLLDRDKALSALSIAPDGSLLAAISPEIISYEPATGSVRWRSIADVTRPGTMVVTNDGEIHLMDLQRYRRLSATTGRELFRNEFDRVALPRIRGSLGCLSASRSYLFAADQRGPLVAVSRAKGSVDWKWEEERPRAASVAPVLSDDRLYALSFDGTLQCFTHSD